MYLLTMLTACAISGLVHTVASVKLPTTVAYRTQDMYSHSASNWVQDELKDKNELPMEYTGFTSF